MAYVGEATQEIAKDSSSISGSISLLGTRLASLSDEIQTLLELVKPVLQPEFDNSKGISGDKLGPSSTMKMEIEHLIDVVDSQRSIIDDATSRVDL